MEKIKIYYKSELDEDKDTLIKDAFGRMEYILIGSGYNFKEEERDLEFEYQPLPYLENKVYIHKKISKITYGDGYFESGKVSGSEHSENTVYLDINGDMFELTDDEALAIVNVITNTLWVKKSGGKTLIK